MPAIAAWALLLAGSAAGLASACSALGTSLWLDELHTAWVASGPLGEVSARAAAGNQLPVYFWWQWAVVQTLGAGEVSLRATSLAAWVCLLLVLARLVMPLARSPQRVFLVGLVAVVALDRNHLFFATEARPYAILALVNLLAWWQLAWLIQQPSLNWQHATRWMLLNALAFWMQPVAVLSWMAQMVAVTTLAACKRDPRLLRMLICASAVQLVTALPAWFILEKTWQARSAWAAFAADASLQNVARQLPLIAVVVPLLVGSLVGVVSCRVTESPTHAAAMANSRGMAWFWFCAWAIPLGLATLLAATKVAPLLHPRYLYASSSLLIVWAAVVMRNWSSAWGWLTMLAMIIVLTLQQGTLTAWSCGQWAGPVRSEDWRALGQKIEADPDPQPLVFCASGLIEGNAPAGFGEHPRSRADYLAFPLESLYRPKIETSNRSNNRLQIVGLLNDPRTWRARFVELAPAGKTCWLAVRCSAAGLGWRLELAGIQPQAAHDFGGVQLVRFQE